MAIDRRRLLRGAGKATAAGAVGVALAAGESAGPSGADRTARPSRARPKSADTPPRFAAARPAIASRTAWQAGPTPPRDPDAPTANTVKAVFVHHTNSENDYTPAEVPDLIRTVQDDHIASRHWDDIGYNFLVDRTGAIYEGRAGSIDGPVVGAHTEGFNIGTVGIAAIGNFSGETAVPAAMLNAIARLAAWKLGLYGVDARGNAVLFSSNDGSRFPEGSRCVFHAISGHRDGFLTTCPGASLYGELGRIRDRAARLQRRNVPRADSPGGKPLTSWQDWSAVWGGGSPGPR
ncbi:peptidoglycan recognition protein [Streptomyces sp. NPDC093589]|uniref:peptidoglycan recognition protein family protein n=1 Tax=Streptomyces sp. NPDC093589 TaxID=3366043 RepID=UPI003806EA8E